MEKELIALDKPFPKVEESRKEVKVSKPRSSILIVFEVFAFKKPEAHVEEASEDEESNDEVVEVKMQDTDRDKKKDEVAIQSKGVIKKHIPSDNLRNKENL